MRCKVITHMMWWTRHGETNPPWPIRPTSPVAPLDDLERRVREDLELIQLLDDEHIAVRERLRLRVGGRSWSSTSLERARGSGGGERGP